MKTKLRGLLVFCGILLSGILLAQERTITGTVIDEDGFPLLDVSIKSSTGEEVYTDLDGTFSIIAKEGDVLTIETLGLEAAKVTVGRENVYNATLRSSQAVELEGAVVTALGITREKKSLGYAVQEVSGDIISAAPVQNFADALSGEVAGLDIKTSGTMGGSTNMIVRGTKSLTGNNQALVVVDGIPINNSTFNSANQMTGRGGYDYGNAASDINPNDIANVSVLKGAAATALYGSRGANGVIMITTKKGKKSSRIGVEFNSSFVVGTADKETLPKYQKQYGGGYMGSFGDSFIYGDINGDGVDELTVNTSNDASYGVAYDPNLMVYNWDSFYYPSLANQLSTYMVASPWVAGKKDPNSIWNNSTTYVNSVSFSGGGDNSSFRVGITNSMHDGNLENSTLKRNTIDFSAGYNFTENLKLSTNFIYTNNMAVGRYGTGYDGLNPMQAFRQWFNLATDMQRQRDVYFQTGQNISWNPYGFANKKNLTTPAYSDNYYFTRHQNYQNDERNRYTGMAALDYKLTSWLSVMGRFTFDNYNELREQRIAAGSAGKVSEYYMNKIDVSENNYDLILSINKNISDNITLDANLGWNLRVNQLNSFAANTNGGLAIPGIFTLGNSANPITANDIVNTIYTKKVDGEYARASLGFYNMVYLEGSIRTDRSSALPISNNRYWYPSGSLSFIFSELTSNNWLSFGKVRFNYAEVGNDTDPYNTSLRYSINAPFNGFPASSNLNTWGNPNLKSERTKGIELGLELAMFKNRIGVDFNYYNTKTFDLITQTSADPASGFQFYFTNVGDIRNKGIELSLRLTPIRTNNFEWNLTANYAKNQNELEYLNVEYYQLASVQGGVSIGGYVGESLGIIRGTDYIYKNGEKVVGSDGQYLLSEPDQIIGNFNPEWTGGLRNMFRYKNLSLSFLIDVQKGGDVFSLDTWYGYATGLYENTVGLNDLGNPVRDPLANGGGVILPGVKEDGTPNDIRVGADNYENPWGNEKSPNKAHVYDASYVKLRNVTLSYSIPEELIRNTFIRKLTFSAIGRNLWIIHKNVPYSDPEAGLSAGNVQGYQSGAYPTIREIGASVKIEF